MLAVADGSDMMGSLRNPAAWNAPPLYSLRPTAGIMEEQVVGHQNDPTLSDDGNPLSSYIHDWSNRQNSQRHGDVIPNNGSLP